MPPIAATEGYRGDRTINGDNPRSESITLYAGTKVATLERVEIPTEIVSAVANVNVPEAGEQVQNML